MTSLRDQSKRRPEPDGPAEAAPGGWLRALPGLLRLHQWIKNGFVAAPLFFTPALLTWAAAGRVALAVAGFCALSSAAYIVNDYLDRDADRRHPTKRRRPLAAGSVPVPLALALAVALTVAGLAAAESLSRDFALFALGYLLLNLVYSFALKHRAILDVMTISIGFVLRVEAGAVVIAVQPSAWIIVASGLLALFLALAKRRDDLVRELGSEHRRSIQGYSKPFLDMAVAIVLGALLVVYLIYATDPLVMQRLGSESVFYTAPFVIAGILRYLQIMLVEERSGSPTRLVLTDRFLILSILGWLLTFGYLIHG